SVEIDAAAGNDIINIVSTLGVPVGANGQDGDDTFNVGSEADRLNLIRNLTLDGGLGQNTLNFMDQGAPNNQAYVLTDDELRIPTDQGLAASFQDIQILTLYGGPLQNAIVVVSTPIGRTTQINAGTGPDDAQAGATTRATWDTSFRLLGFL